MGERQVQADTAEVNPSPNSKNTKQALQQFIQGLQSLNIKNIQQPCQLYKLSTFINHFIETRKTIEQINVEEHAKKSATLCKHQSHGEDVIQTDTAEDYMQADSVETNQLDHSFEANLLGDTLEANLLDHSLEANLLDDTLEPNVLHETLEANLLDNTLEANQLHDTFEANLLDDTLEPNVLDETLEANLLDNTLEANLLHDSFEANLLDDTLEANLLDDTLEPNSQDDSAEVDPQAVILEAHSQDDTAAANPEDNTSEFNPQFDNIGNIEQICKQLKQVLWAPQSDETQQVLHHILKRYLNLVRDKIKAEESVPNDFGEIHIVDSTKDLPHSDILAIKRLRELLNAEKLENPDQIWHILKTNPSIIKESFIRRGCRLCEETVAGIIKSQINFKILFQIIQIKEECRVKVVDLSAPVNESTSSKQESNREASIKPIGVNQLTLQEMEAQEQMDTSVNIKKIPQNEETDIQSDNAEVNPPANDTQHIEDQSQTSATVDTVDSISAQFAKAKVVRDTIEAKMAENTQNFEEIMTGFRKLLGSPQTALTKEKYYDTLKKNRLIIAVINEKKRMVFEQEKAEELAKMNSTTKRRGYEENHIQADTEYVFPEDEKNQQALQLLRETMRLPQTAEVQHRIRHILETNPSIIVDSFFRNEHMVLKHDSEDILRDNLPLTMIFQKKKHINYEETKIEKVGVQDSTLATQQDLGKMKHIQADNAEGDDTLSYKQGLQTQTPVDSPLIVPQTSKEQALKEKVKLQQNKPTKSKTKLQSEEASLKNKQLQQCRRDVPRSKMDQAHKETERLHKSQLKNSHKLIKGSMLPSVGCPVHIQRLQNRIQLREALFGPAQIAPQTKTTKTGKQAVKCPEPQEQKQKMWQKTDHVHVEKPVEEPKQMAKLSKSKQKKQKIPKTDLEWTVPSIEHNQKASWHKPVDTPHFDSSLFNQKLKQIANLQFLQAIRLPDSEEKWQLMLDIFDSVPSPPQFDNTLRNKIAVEQLRQIMAAREESETNQLAIDANPNEKPVI